MSAASSNLASSSRITLPIYSPPTAPSVITLMSQSPNLTFKSVLWLDDYRRPLIPGIVWVKNYDQFVAYLQQHSMPDLISFDHDLAESHYSSAEGRPGYVIPYETYTEKTGLEAARYLVENALPLKHWAVHSLNAQGKINIENELRAYCPRGEVKGLKIPYEIVD